MAKNTHAQEVATGTSDSYTDDEAADPELPQHVIITRPYLDTVDHATITEAYATKGKAIGEPAERVIEAEIRELDNPDFDSDEEAESSVVEDGGGFTMSSQNESSESSKPSQSPRRHVPTTDSRSSQTPEEVSDAHSTDGDGLKTEPQQSAKGRKTPAKKYTPTRPTGARTTMMGAEDDFDEFN